MSSSRPSGCGYIVFERQEEESQDPHSASRDAQPLSPDSAQSSPASPLPDVQPPPASLQLHMHSRPPPNSDESYFESLVDKFVSAVDTDAYALHDDDDIWAAFRQTSNLLAETAIKHYNDNEKNKIKYELINVVERSQVMEDVGFYNHLNFTAKGKEPSSKEEFFFAEVFGIGEKWGSPYKATCVLPLKGDKIGGLFGTVIKSTGKDLPIDHKHCYACEESMMHPKNVQFEAGHDVSRNYNLLCCSER